MMNGYELEDKWQQMGTKNRRTVLVVQCSGIWNSVVTAGPSSKRDSDYTR